MKGIAFKSGLFGILLTSSMLLPVSAQVTSDGTTNTTVNTNGNNFTIINGIQRGNNLFHSFGDFSIPTGGSAVFNNSAAVENIINRVTGGNISNIDGLIKANGNANLFLINPNGIVFGENARLDISGSFLGSTAESILFEDGFEFSAVNPQSKSLLTVSVPVGLHMGSNPEDITVQGNGHDLILANPALFMIPIEWNNTSVGLEINSGKTLALLGGNVNLSGGILTASGGSIEIGAVASNEASGVVSLRSVNQKWNLDLSNIENLGDVSLTQKALLNNSGTESGSIQVQGSRILLEDGSVFVQENRGRQNFGEIILRATQAIELVGSIPGDDFRSGIISDTLKAGRGGDILFTAPKIELGNNGGAIISRNFASGNGGNIFVDTNNFNITGGLERAGFLLTKTGGSGRGGSININTFTFTLQKGASLASSVTQSSGSSGDITLNASEAVNLIGAEDDALVTTLIGASATGGTGDAGNVTITTPRLTLTNGAIISSSTFDAGNAGSITINASESLEIEGFRLDSLNQKGFSTIRSSAPLLSPVFRQIFGVPDKITGNAGTVEINTPSLQVKDGGLITVSHDSLGNAGKVEVNADSVILDGEGKITATTTSGEGGNINLNLTSDLILRNNSLIDTEAFGTGNGGNITVNSPVIAGLENSDIIANAFQGMGGNIDIKTQGIFGLEFRDSLTPESDITASSQFGVSGTVKINNLSIDPNSGLVELPVKLTDPSQQITNSCNNTNGSSFVATGRGGIPQNPNERVDSNVVWSDVRDLSAYRNQKKVNRSNTSENARVSTQFDVVEATALIRNQNGNIELVALLPKSFQTDKKFNCSGVNNW